MSAEAVLPTNIAWFPTVAAALLFFVLLRAVAIPGGEYFDQLLAQQVGFLARPGPGLVHFILDQIITVCAASRNRF